MPKNSSQSFTKTVFFTFGIFILTYFVYSISSNFLADITMESDEYEISNTENRKFLLALDNKNKKYFNSLSKRENHAFIKKIFTPFVKTLDTTVFHKNNHLFFSFLGLKKNSSILHNVYGSYNKQNSTLSAFPNLFVQIVNINIDSNEIILKNTSQTILPIQNSLMLMPQNIKIMQRDNTNSKVLLLEPNSEISFTSSKLLPNIQNIHYIESIDFGYKAKVMIKSK